MSRRLVLSHDLVGAYHPIGKPGIQRAMDLEVETSIALGQGARRVHLEGFVQVEGLASRRSSEGTVSFVADRLLSYTFSFLGDDGLDHTLEVAQRLSISDPVGGTRLCGQLIRGGCEPIGHVELRLDWRRGLSSIIGRPRLER